MSEDEADDTIANPYFARDVLMEKYVLDLVDQPDLVWTLAMS